MFRKTLAPALTSSGVMAAAASEDGRTLVLAMEQGEIQIHDLLGGKPLLPPLVHSTSARPVGAVAIDATSRRLVSGGEDGWVKLWDLVTGELLRSVRVFQGAVSVLAFSPDGKTVVSGSHDGEARLWWLDRSSELGPKMDHKGPFEFCRVNHLAFSPDGSVVAVSGGSNEARLWWVDSGLAAGSPMAHIDSSTYGLFMFWTKDGRRLITSGSHDNTARIWDVQSGQMLTKPMEHPTAAYSMALRPDSEALLFGESSGNRARVWDLGSGDPLTPYLDHDGLVESSAWNATGSRIVTGTRAGSAYLWDIPAPRESLPEWFLTFAESLGGFRFSEAGVLESVPLKIAQESEQAARQLASSYRGSGSVWLRWLTMDGEDRTTSPRSDVSADEYIEILVGEKTVGSLREALLLRPDDAQIMGKLGYALVFQHKPSERKLVFGDFLSRRSVELDPDNAALLQLRVLVVGRLRVINLRKRIAIPDPGREEP